MIKKIISYLKQHTFLRHLIIFIGILALLFFSYCWGLWGHNSRWAQYLFQCSCPRISETTRYPPESVEILLPVCSGSFVSAVSPSGNLLAVKETSENYSGQSYLWNLENDEKIPYDWQYPPHIFLTENLIYNINSAYTNHYVYNLYSGEQYQLEYLYDFLKNLNDSNISAVELNRLSDISLEPPDSYDPTNVTSIIHKVLHEAEQIYLYIGLRESKAIVLGKDFQLYPERNLILSQGSIEDGELEKLLQDNNIDYHKLDMQTSPDGRFIIRDRKIYLVETGKIIMDINNYPSNYPSSIKGWVYDSSGVIMSGGGRYLINVNRDPLYVFQLFYAPTRGSIKLKIPAEYLP